MSTRDWSRDAERVKEFHIAAYTALVKHGVLEPHATSGMKPWHNDAYMNVYNRWRSGEGGRSDDREMADYLDSFIRETIRDYAPARRHNVLMKVSCKVTRHYGTVDIEFGLEGEYLIHNDGQIPGAFDQLRELIEGQHQRTAENNPALMPVALKEHDGLNIEIVQMTEIRKEFVDNKTRIRLCGGEYSKHGVAVYDEFLEALKIDPSTLDFGTTPYNHLVKIQLDQKGNPKRALEIVSQPQG